jgi:hypothetical protein
MRVQVVKGCRAMGCGLVLAIAWGVAGAVPAATTQPVPVVELDVDGDHVPAAADATRPRAPDMSQAAVVSRSEREWVQSTVKELAGATGAADVVRGLNAELNKAKADAAFDILRDADVDAAHAERPRTDMPAREAGRTDATGAPLTEEQRKLEEMQAASLFAQLVDEVTPWALGALALYAAIYVVRLVLAYSRAKASRKSRQAARRSRSRSSRGARL